MGLITRLGAAVRAFQASKTTAHYTPPRNALFSPDGAVQDAGPHLRAWGRHFDENTDLAVGVLDELVSNVVGRGIQIEPMVLDPSTETPLDGINSALADLLEEWSERPDVTGQIAWGEVQRLIARAWFRDGDHFQHHVQGYARGYDFEPGRIPYALELVEGDRVPADLTTDKSDPRIFQGVELDRWHRPLSYRVYVDQPGPNNVRFSPVATAGFLAKTTAVPAAQMTHLAVRRRYPQVRGVSIFAPVTRRLWDLHDYDESERIAARTAARIAMWIYRDPEHQYTAPEEGKEREITLPQGSVFDELQAGEDIKTTEPGRPNRRLNEFRQGQLRAVAAGSGTRYSAIARDFDHTYSAQRQELVEARNAYAPLTELFIHAVVQPAYRRLVETALISGRLTIPAALSLRDLTRCEFVGPAIPWIDPEKEVKADILAIDNGLATREQVIRRRGGDPRKVPEVQRREQQTAPASSSADSDTQASD